MTNFYVFVLLVTSYAVTTVSHVQASSEIREVFCTDGAGLFYVSAEKDVTSPPTKARLRILQFQDGKLLLTMEQQLVYPMVPNLTPVFLSKEDNLIMLPDLETKGAAVGLQLPEGQHLVVHGLLQHPTPPEHVAQVVFRAESVAAGLVQRAEAMGDLIEEKATSWRAGPPAAPGGHTVIKAGAHYARTATDQILGATTWATNMVGQATEKVGNIMRPVMPRLNQQRNSVGTVGKPKRNNRPKHQAEKIANDLTAVSIEALDKIREALKKSAQILATSIKENTVKVVEHRFGEDVGEAMGDMFESVKNTVTAAQQIRDLRPVNIAQKAVRQALTGQIGRKEPQYRCKEDL